MLSVGRRILFDGDFNFRSVACSPSGVLVMKFRSRKAPNRKQQVCHVAAQEPPRKEEIRIDNNSRLGFLFLAACIELGTLSVVDYRREDAALGKF